MRDMLTGPSTETDRVLRPTDTGMEYADVLHLIFLVMLRAEYFLQRYDVLEEFAHSIVIVAGDALRFCSKWGMGNVRAHLENWIHSSASSRASTAKDPMTAFAAAAIAEDKGLVYRVLDDLDQSQMDLMDDVLSWDQEVFARIPQVWFWLMVRARRDYMHDSWGASFAEILREMDESKQ